MPDSAENQCGTDAISFDTLAVVVTVEAGRFALTLEALGNLYVGQLCRWPGLPAEVILRAQGRAIARGRLVNVDGEAAVEISGLIACPDRD